MHGERGTEGFDTIPRMNRSGPFFPLRWVAVIFLLFAVIMTAFQLVSFSRIRSNYPTGLVIGGIPVGGLDAQAAAERLVLVYTTTPVEIHYRDSIIQMRPSSAGFELDLEGMIAAADLERVQQPFWNGFWDYLWNRAATPAEVPLLSTYSDERLRSYLEEVIAPRYDQTGDVPLPVPGSTGFQSGREGSRLDVERAVILISDALRSPRGRQVSLTYTRLGSPRPSIENLKILLQQIIQTEKTEGTLEIYMKNLASGEEIRLAMNNGTQIQPDIAFTAASTMKIPIMISVYRRSPEPLPAETLQMIDLMIEFSENDPADRLMEKALDPNLGPLQVTEDIQTLGLQNTFLAGYFYPGAPLLRRYNTPANSRSDIDTSPDPYNQTTATEMGELLEDIYFCSQRGGGTLTAAYPGEITQTECQQMIAVLSRNRNGVLIEAGLPEGTQVAHKHGWILEADGLIHHISDAGLVFSPGGNYIFTIYMHQTQQLLFDPANLLVCKLSEASYNYMNMEQQIDRCNQ